MLASPPLGLHKSGCGPSSAYNGLGPFELLAKAPPVVQAPRTAQGSNCAMMQAQIGREGDLPSSDLLLPSLAALPFCSGCYRPHQLVSMASSDIDAEQGKREPPDRPNGYDHIAKFMASFPKMQSFVALAVCLQKTSSIDKQRSTIWRSSFNIHKKRSETPMLTSESCTRNPGGRCNANLRGREA
jgi:hypothetical protein